MSFGLEQGETQLRIELHSSLVWPARLLYGGVLVLLLSAVAATWPYPPWMVVGVLGLVFAAPFLFYATYRESLIATRDALRIERRTLGFISWAHEHSIEDVRWFRAVEEGFSEDEEWHMTLLPRVVAASVIAADGRFYRQILGCGSNRLAFNVGTRTYAAGPGLTTDDATSVAGLIRDWIHAHQRTVDTAYS